MYKSIVWPGVSDFKTACGLWLRWFKDKFEEIIFKIYMFESKLD